LGDLIYHLTNNISLHKVQVKVDITDWPVSYVLNIAFPELRDVTLELHSIIFFYNKSLVLETAFWRITFLIVILTIPFFLAPHPPFLAGCTTYSGKTMKYISLLVGLFPRSKTSKNTIFFIYNCTRWEKHARPSRRDSTRSKMLLDAYIKST